MYLVFLVIPRDCEDSGEQSLEMINIGLQWILGRIASSLIHEYVDVFKECFSQQTLIISVIRCHEIICPEVNLFVNFWKMVVTIVFPHVFSSLLT